MEEITYHTTIELHYSYCECSNCKPWQNRMSTAGTFPYRIIYMDRSAWQKLGCPQTIEEYLEKPNVCFG